MNGMKEKELSVCIWIHHIATFAGIAEGIYYLTVKRHRCFKRFGIFLLTIFQILKDLRSGRSRLTKSCENIKELTDSRKKRQGILFGLTFATAVFKVLPVHILGHS